MEGEKGAFEITEAYFEIDKTRDGKYWLWLKIRSDIACPMEVRLRNKDNGGRYASFKHPQGHTIKEISLGYHALKPGLNELPPLPFLIESKGMKYFMVTINVKSLRTPTVSHRVTEPVFSTPFFIPGENIPQQNFLN